jgi:hypothetical protein
MATREVTIESRTVVIGGDESGLTVGSFSRDGDAGITSGEYRGRGRGAFTASEVLAGREGMLRFRIEGVFGPVHDGVAEGAGHWLVIGGTGAYENARGTGTWTAVRDYRKLRGGLGLPSAKATYIGLLAGEN